MRIFVNQHYQWRSTGISHLCWWRALALVRSLSSYIRAHIVVYIDDEPGSLRADDEFRSGGESCAALCKSSAANQRLPVGSCKSARGECSALVRSVPNQSHQTHERVTLAARVSPT
jgi:hypothetical protein